MKEQTRFSRRDFLRLTAVTATGTFIAACAPAATPTEKPAEATAEPQAPVEEKVTIRWQDWSDWEPNMDRLMDLFESKLPNITVEFEPLTDDFEDKTLTMMIAGTAPDVMTGWGPVFMKWAEKGQLLDMQPYVDTTYTAEEISDFHPWQWAGMIHPETRIRFAMPYYVNLIMLLYDKEAFDEAGVAYPTADMDHDDYAAMLLEMNKEEEGKIVRWGGLVPLWFDRLHAHIQAFGGHVVNPDDWTECMLDKPEAQEALEWLRARMWDDNSLLQPLQAEDRGPAEMWPTRLIATAEGGMGNLAFYAEEADFEWDMTHLPKGPARRATLGTNDGWAIWEGTKNPDAAWEFMTVLAGKEFQMLISEAWGGIPNRLSLLPGWKDQVLKGFPMLENVNLDVVLEALQEGYPLNSEQFKKQAESGVLIDAALEKVFMVGDTPVSHFIDVAKEVTAVNRAS
jgi:multiple sugar transport system substrate-binding protein